MFEAVNIHFAATTYSAAAIVELGQRSGGDIRRREDQNDLSTTQTRQSVKSSWSQQAASRHHWRELHVPAKAPAKDV